jgi:photosynthetic reaction center cytochrome c subunit
MKNLFAIPLAVTAVTLLVLAMMFGVGWDRPPVAAEQIGFRGVGMENVSNPRVTAQLEALNQMPPPPYELTAEEIRDSPLAGEVYENVQVLGDLPEVQFTRLMAAITEWVAPEEGCGYCHNLENLADDSVYTKIVSRRMIQMTWNINENWGNHVQETGVNCYTCHRGKNVPEYIWFENAGLPAAQGAMGWRNGQNIGSGGVAGTSLPYDPFSAYLVGDEPIRVQVQQALPASTGSTGGSIQSTEKTYALMLHMSESLGVNCTYCHNSRAFGNWEQSPPARTTAYHGIDMVREMNTDYLVPLRDTYPENRLGPTGDAPKAYCSTCHQGVNKPLLGAPMLEQWPSLAASP